MPVESYMPTQALAAGTSVYERELSLVLSSGVGLLAVLLALVLATATLSAAHHKPTERPACCQASLVPHSH
jgi:hypothetical protein